MVRPSRAAAVKEAPLGGRPEGLSLTAASMTAARVVEALDRELHSRNEALWWNKLGINSHHHRPKLLQRTRSRPTEPSINAPFVAAAVPPPVTRKATILI